jgi:hypothetical protein
MAAEVYYMIELEYMTDKTRQKGRQNLPMYFPNEILRCRKQCERPMVFPCAIATIFHFLFLCVLLCRVEKEIPKETGSLIECVDKHVVYTVFQKIYSLKKSSKFCNTYMYVYVCPYKEACAEVDFFYLTHILQDKFSTNSTCGASSGLGN